MEEKPVFPHGKPNGYIIDDPTMDVFDCKRGLRVTPKKGTAVFWYDMTAKGHMKGEIDLWSLHAGCPPLKGEKWGANKWISNKKLIHGQHAYESWTDEAIFGPEGPL